MNSSLVTNDPALDSMTLSFLGNIFKRTDEPREMAAYLTEEMRELTGARCVLLIRWKQDQSGVSHRLFGVNPAQRCGWAESSDAKQFYSCICGVSEPYLLRQDDPLDAGGFLHQEGLDPSLVVPLYEGDTRLGLMLLLGLPDQQHMGSVISLLDHLAPAVSLVLRNALFYEEQEQIIERRTAKLWELNRRLQIELAERRRAEQSLRDREREVASLLEISEESRRALLGILEDEKRTEAELARYQNQLEDLVSERTCELEKSREQLQRAERLASIGTLAAGIAHEINNPLGMMMLGADLALRSLEKPDSLAELLRQQKQDLERCSRIVRGVLNFARQLPTEKWPLDLNEVVRHGLDFTREYARMHGVTVEARLADLLDPMVGNATELEQVVVNLVNNAVQACSSGGHVTAETYQLADMLRLVVRDDGRGLTSVQIQHAFDPFYTTRLEKGGTGLGLSTVHGIVTGHGGTIGVASEAGRGAVFTIEFPRHTAARAGHDPAGGGVDTSGGHGLESSPVGPLAAREPGPADRA